ncbi:MAG: hypothetical protein JW891_09965 [Candidatus Lokiarchaeota archaeon]|nr:hypothetical protein [Candidatus Lokiarchaeota archaeon]
MFNDENGFSLKNPFGTKLNYNLYIIVLTKNSFKRKIHSIYNLLGSISIYTIAISPRPYILGCVKVGYRSLDNVERQIYEISKEYLKKKSLFSLVNLIDYVNKRTKYNSDVNKNKIELVVKSLIKKKLILPGTRLIKQELLENPTRKKIYETIKEEPGINMTELMKIENLGSNQVVWHLSFLVKFECIRSREFGNQKAYYSHRSNPNKDELYFYLRNDKVKQIIDALEEINDIIKPTNLKTVLGMNYKTIKKYLDILCDLGVVRKEKDEKGYYFNKNLLQE